MVMPGLAKRKSNIDVRLNGIRERLEEYCYDRVGELLAPAGKVRKGDVLTPVEEARKTAETQQVRKIYRQALSFCNTLKEILLYQKRGFSYSETESNGSAGNSTTS